MNGVCMNGAKSTGGRSVLGVGFAADRSAFCGRRFLPSETSSDRDAQHSPLVTTLPRMDDPPSASRTPSYAPPLRSTAGSTGSSDGEPPAGRLVQEQQQQQQQPTLPRRPAAGSNRLVDGTSSSYLPLGPPSRPGSASRMAAPHFAPTPPPVLVSGSSSASSSTAGQRRASATGPPPQPPPPPSAAAGSSSTSKTTKVKSKGKTRAPAKPKGLAARLVANGTSDEDSRSESDDDAAGRPDGKKKRKRVERACCPSFVS